ncbi:MAG: hypothetical protein RSA24_03400 [Clostridia bacterium]
MKKFNTVLLIILVICLSAGCLVACNPTIGGGNTNGIPTEKPEEPGSPDDPSIISSNTAWNILKNAALNTAGEDGGRYLNFDTTFEIGYNKSALNALFNIRFAGSVDTKDDKNTRILVEFVKAKNDKKAEKLLMGMYYGMVGGDMTLIADLSGLRAGTHTVKTKDIDMTKLAMTIRDVLDALNISELFFEKLCGMSLGSIIGGDLGGILGITIEKILKLAVIGSNQSKLIDMGNGHKSLELPLDMSLILGLIPLISGLIPENIGDLIYKIIGIDLGKLGALVGVAVYLKADLVEEKGATTPETKYSLGGLGADIGVNLNSYGKTQVIKNTAYSKKNLA